MKTFFLAVAGAILGTILAIVLMIFVGSMVLSGLSKPKPMPDSIILTLDLREELPDQAPSAGLAALFGQQGFTDYLVKLDAAASDDAVKGVFVRGSEYGIGSSRAEEIRSALKKLQANGKIVVAHSQGSYGGGPSGYRALATADEIWAQPGGDLIASGVKLETLFLRGLLDKLSITPQIVALYEYKNAPNTFRETDFTEPHREALLRLAESIWDISLEDISTDRNLTVDQVRDALESGPLSADMMVESKLADQIGWPETARESLKNRFDEDLSFLGVGEYRPRSSKFSSPVIAIVGGEGPVVTGWADESPFSQESADISSDTIATAILDAAKNEKVRAIVFRVDSPGGSPTASDQIWNAVDQARNQYGKPVVVSMGSVAASGGYYISTGADWIVANRATITGSIGIFGGKMAYAEGLAKIGVNVRSVGVGGEFAGALSSPEIFTESQLEQVNAWLKRGYDRFLEVVSEGRKMTTEEVHERARGRVWSGEDALEQGLVDELGGFVTAIEKARELAEIEADEDVRLLKYPMHQSGLPIGGGGVGVSADIGEVSRVMELLSDPRAQALLQELEATQSGGLQARLPAVIEN